MPRTDTERIAEMEARLLSISSSVPNYAAMLARIQSLKNPSDNFATIAAVAPAGIAAAVGTVGSAPASSDTHDPTSYSGAVVRDIYPGDDIPAIVSATSAGTSSAPKVFRLHNAAAGVSSTARYLYELNGATIEPKAYHYFVGDPATRTLVQTRTSKDGTAIPAYTVACRVAIRSTGVQGVFRPVTDANNIILENLECYGPTGTKDTDNDDTKKWGRIVNGDRGTVENITAKWCHFWDWNNAVIGGCEGTIMEDCYAHDGGDSSYTGCCASVVKAGNGDISVTRCYFHDVICTGMVWTDCDAGSLTCTYTTMIRASRTGVYFEVSGASGSCLVRYCAFEDNNHTNYERGGGASCVSSKNVTFEQNYCHGDNVRQAFHVRNDGRSNGSAKCGPGGYPASNVIIRNNLLNGDDITGTDLSGVTSTGNV